MTEFFGRVAGRVIKRANKTGYSYNFQIVKNQRNYMTGSSEHLIVANLGTIKDSEFAFKAKSFWDKVDSTLAILIASEKIYNNSAEDVCRKFENFIPRPTVSVAAPVPAAKPVSNSDVSERLRRRFPHLLKDL